MSDNAAINLEYIGPVKELGFTGPVTGNVYLARPGQPFAVAEQDAGPLLTRFSDVLIKAKPKRKAKPDGGSTEETDTK